MNQITVFDGPVSIMPIKKIGNAYREHRKRSFASGAEALINHCPYKESTDCRFDDFLL